MVPILNLIFSPPLRTCCSLADAELCSRTCSGKRCALGCCVDLMPGIHISHSPFYNYSRSSSVFIKNPLQTEARLLSVDSPALPALQFMPRLRQRMRCRRGSSCGQVNRQPSSSTSASSSYSSDFGPVRFLASRRGRGWGRGQPNSATHFRLSSRPQSHISRLQYPCTLSNFTFLAKVTIELHEVSAGLVMATPGVALVTGEDNTPGTTQTDIMQSMEPEGNAT